MLFLAYQAHFLREFVRIPNAENKSSTGWYVLLASEAPTQSAVFMTLPLSIDGVPVGHQERQLLLAEEITYMQALLAHVSEAFRTNRTKKQPA